MYRDMIMVAYYEYVGEDGSVVDSNRYLMEFSDEAYSTIDPLLATFGRTLDEFCWGGVRPAPWALVFLDREYNVAGHLAEIRRSNSEFKFAAYRLPTMPLPDDYYPAVGVIALFSKNGLEELGARSPVIEACWEALSYCAAECHWVVTLDPLPEEWLKTAVSEDERRWRSYKERKQ